MSERIIIDYGKRGQEEPYGPTTSELTLRFERNTPRHPNQFDSIRKPEEFVKRMSALLGGWRFDCTETPLPDTATLADHMAPQLTECQEIADGAWKITITTAFTD
jgi:hypothetical protein